MGDRCSTHSAIQCREWEIESLVPSAVKQITYKIDTCHFLAWDMALLGQCKDWFAQCQDNVTEWDIGAGGLIFP